MSQTDDISKNSISLAGEFAVLSQLMLRGFDANMTLGHTKSVDILVSDPKTGNMFKIEVKTSYNKSPSHDKLFGYGLAWILNNKHETLFDPDLFYCFVNIEQQTNIFRFFSIPSSVVANYLKDALAWYLKHHRNPNHNIRTFRIGLDDDESNYNISTPLAKDYENKWGFSLSK